MSTAAVDVRDLRIELTGRDADVVDEISGWSANPDRARRPSAWRCSATCGAAAGSAAARC
jgi:hypothetical protein